MHNKTEVGKSIDCPICKGDDQPEFVNATVDNRCVNDIAAELQIYTNNIYIDKINNKIEQITSMLLPEIGSIPMGRRRKKGLFDGVGRLLSFITGVATDGDLIKLQQRLQIFENVISENQDSSRLQMGHLLTAERLLARRVDDKLGDFKRNAHAVSESLETLISSSEGLTREVQYIRGYIKKLVRWTQSSIRGCQLFGSADSGVDLGREECVVTSHHAH